MIQTEPDIAVLDLGFGTVKSKFRSLTFYQPTVAGESKLLLEQSINPNDFRLGDDIFVGDLALRHSSIKYFTMKDDKTRNDNINEVGLSEIIIKTALGYLIKNKKANVVTGLPYTFYHAQKESMIQIIRSINDLDEYVVRKGNKQVFKVKPQIMNISVSPQGYGIGMDYFLDERGKLQKDKKSLAKKKILVVDIGFFTINLIVLEDGLQIGAGSDTLKIGVHTAYYLLKQYIQQYFGKTVELYELDKHVLSGQFDGYDIKPLIQRAFKALTTQMINSIESLNSNFDFYIFGGGATKFIEEYIPYKNREIVDQFSQISGYEKIGAFQWQNKKE